MRNRLLSIVAVIVTSLCTPPAQGGLVLHWDLDESSGTTAADSSGNGIHGAWQGNVGSPAWLPAGGIDGGAFQFTGANLDSFITSSFSAIAGTPLTISLWLKTLSTENDGLAYLGNGATGNQYYVVRLQANLPRANARNTAEVQAVGTTAVNDDQWHHLAGVYTSAAERAIYVDGALQASNFTTVDPFALTRFGIGALTRNTPYAPADLYNGLLDDVQLYDQALDESQIAFLFNNPGQVVPEPATGLLVALGAGLCLFRRHR